MKGKMSSGIMPPHGRTFHSKANDTLSGTTFYFVILSKNELKKWPDKTGNSRWISPFNRTGARRNGQIIKTGKEPFKAPLSAENVVCSRFPFLTTDKKASGVNFTHIYRSGVFEWIGE